MAMGSSLDQIGPITKTVEDARIIFDTIRGKDALDSTSIAPDLYQAHAPVKKIGVPRALLKEGIEADVLERFEESLKKLASAGYELVDVDLPSAPLALALYYIIMPAEASSNLARFDGVRYGLSLKGGSLVDDYAKTRAEGFGPEVRRRIMLGTYVLSAGYYDAYYGKAIAARAELSKEVAGVLETVDAIVTPTAPFPAFNIGEKSDPLSMYLADIFTVTANLTGNPALSVPMGAVERDGKSLPVGIQFTASHGDEAMLFAVGHALQ
jgi:aspartyl-tRNA(Asn)/glutamyl-tRNA(Gln) amidotransferase subunit A